ncbi:autotransporter domain-containing protein [uncultured Pseudodesulfovibrio sp.]|uniref:autotransporter domain-containing protein n=1 Tax=uncultured Pseudodesulfovibrio sp. TaxID=2035858 RepID=UPI0029C61D6F|nr:autotransporter domain-containing protein [uncultured Pseudodesulfovibrio sp.]
MPSIRHPFHALCNLFTRFALLPLLLALLLCPPAMAAGVDAASGTKIVVSGDGSTIAYQQGGGIYSTSGTFGDGNSVASSTPLLGVTSNGTILGGEYGLGKQYYLYSGAEPRGIGDLYNGFEGAGISSDGLAIFGIMSAVVGSNNTGMLIVTNDSWATSTRYKINYNGAGEGMPTLNAVSNNVGGVRTVVGTRYDDIPVMWKTSGTDLVETQLGLLYNGIYYNSGQANDITDNAAMAVGKVGSNAATWNLATRALTLLPTSDATTTYTSSRATAVTSDGSVIVGAVSSAFTNAAYWTGSGTSYTLQTLYDALTAKGVALSTHSYLREATGVSDDGSVIVGLTDTGSGEVFIARLSGTGTSGVITPAQMNQSLGAMGQVGPAVTGMGQLSMSRLGGVAGGQGMHFTVSAPGPASGAPSAGTGSETGLSSGDDMPGRLDLWVVGTVGTNIELNGDDLGLHGGVGLTWERGEWRVGGGLFGDSRDLDTSYNGNQDIQALGPGAFVAYTPEGTGLEFRVSGLWQTVDLDLKRGYANGAGSATSKGSTNADVFGLSGRVQWTRDVTDQLALTPFAEYTWQTTHIDGYSESGGPFPASFDSRNETSNSLRAGLRADAALLDKVATWAWIAWDHRFEDKSSGLGGTSLGLGSFTYAGSRVDQDWADTGLGASWDVTERLSANTTLGFALGCDDDTMSDLNVTLGFSYQLW